MGQDVCEHREWQHPFQPERSRRFLRTPLSNDLSWLEDIRGDPNALFKPIEHTNWVVMEGGLEIFFVA